MVVRCSYCKQMVEESDYDFTQNACRKCLQFFYNFNTFPRRRITINLGGILDRIEQQNWIIKYTIYAILNFIFLGLIIIGLIMLWNMHPLFFVIVSVMLIPTVIDAAKDMFQTIHSLSLKQSLPSIIIFLDFVLSYLILGIWLVYPN